MNPDIALLERIMAGDVSLPAAFDSSEMARALDMRVMSFDRSSREAVTAYTPGQIFLQGAGVLQGGAVAAMLDFAMIIPVMMALGAGAAPATTNLDIAYFRPAPPGTYHAQARVVRSSRSLVFTQAMLTSPEGAEIASATATNFVKLAA